MYDYFVLPPSLRDRVLRYLECPSGKPGLHALNGLIRAYVQKVPWESASRIAKRSRTPMLVERPRWPEEFWSDALEKGAGGTCFESNYAFMALLRSLGYEGYLTINNMGESIGCHTAIVLTLPEEKDGQRRLVDVGIPLHKSLPLRREQVLRIPSLFHTYIVRPKGEQQYDIERTNHPKRHIFTLIDEPVSDSCYRTATTQDYGDGGLFLDRVIITKIIEGKVWRFNSSDRPLQLEAFERNSKTEILLPENLLARRLASYFGMDRTILQSALNVVASH